MRIIDFECDTPTREAAEDTVRLIKAGRGFDKEGYANLMGRGWAAQLGMSLAAFEAERRTEGGLTRLALKLCDKHLAEAMSEEEVIALLDEAGVEAACVGNAGRRADNAEVAAFAKCFADRLVPWFRIWGEEGEMGVAELERGVRELGCAGFEIASYREGRSIDDPVYRPFLAKCVELKIPVRITTGVHLLSDRAWDLAHPRHLDAIAIAFPDLTIVAGLTGWPWVGELVAIALRHRNLFIDFACRRVRQLMAPGAGYEPLIYYGAR
ncbi:MAG: amidohydrolase family protein, partial [Caulobacteraceae bacterium]